MKQNLMRRKSVQPRVFSLWIKIKNHLFFIMEPVITPKNGKTILGRNLLRQLKNPQPDLG